MSETAIKRSPIHAALEARGGEWGVVAGMPVAVRFASDEAERAAMQTLGLCDLSGLPKLGVKGPRAERWLLEQELQIELPAGIYESCRDEGGGLIVRLARDEFLLQSAPAPAAGGLGDLVGRLDARLGDSVVVRPSRLPPVGTEKSAGGMPDPQSAGGMPDPQSAGGTPAPQRVEGVYRIERQEATWLLVGVRGPDVFAQTCGVNFGEAPAGRVLFTRVAGVSCGIFPETIGDVPAWRMWVNCSYAPYLWDTLVEITESLDGRVIGAGCLFPQLQT